MGPRALYTVDERSLGLVAGQTVRMRGVRVRALELPFVWEGPARKKPQITGCQPDSGKPTVRDERGACGDVGYGTG
jgi:hypothetical protein